MTRHMALVACYTTCAIISSNAQQLVNGDFEDPGMHGAPPAGWTVTKGTLICDSAKRKSGKFSGKIDGGDHDSTAYQDVHVKPGESYVLRGVWRNGDKTATFDVARVSVVWLDAPDGAQVEKGDVVDSGDVVSNWTPFQLGPLTAPPGAGAARIRIMATFNTGAFDSLEWEKADSDSAAVATSAISSTAAAGSQLPQLYGHEIAAGGKVDPKTTKDPSGNGSGIGTRENPQSDSALVWVTDLAAGYRAAASAQKKILVFFSADDDPNTRYFEKSVFADGNIQSIIADKFVPLRVDYNARRKIADKLGVKSPGTIVIYEDDGSAINIVTDQISAAAFEAILNK